MACWALLPTDFQRGFVFALCQRVSRLVYLFRDGAGLSPLTARYKVALVTLPTVLVVVLAFTSCWTHALFYIDAQGVYHRCFAYMIQPIVSYCYVIHTSLHAFVQSRRVESLQKKAIYRTLAFFAIPVLVGGTFQVVFSVPGLCVGIMISMLLLCIVCQEQLISTDPLTGLNNRNRFETYMLSLFSNADHTGDVYLLMMDADGFKQINDRYGHVEVTALFSSSPPRPKMSARRLVALSHVMAAMSS